MTEEDRIHALIAQANAEAYQLMLERKWTLASPSDELTLQERRAVWSARAMKLMGLA